MKYTLQEWKDEQKKRFKDNLLDVAFVCPACGKVSTLREFKEAGATPDDSYQNCIGRFTGKGSPNQSDGTGCNWAAYGLFGCLGKGDVVVTPDGNEVEVFQLAPGRTEIENFQKEEKE